MKNVKRIWFLLLTLSFLVGAWGTTQSQATTQDGEVLPILLGVYSRGYAWESGVLDQLHDLDSWALDIGGKKVSIIAQYIDIQNPHMDYLIPNHLGLLWDNGYTPFINLTTSATAAQIAQGNLDSNLQQLASLFATWSQGGQRMAFIAPLPDMNVSWVPYGTDPENFKLAFRRIQKIFRDNGVPSASVQWIFAPNSYHTMYDTPFEEYYPGDEDVDILGLSALNYGYCSGTANDTWNGWEQLFTDNLARFWTLSSSKPIFITKTATTGQYPQQGVYSQEKKDQWINEIYTHLAASYGVKAVVYFNISQECDWGIFDTGGQKFDGYRTATTNPAYGYVKPTALVGTDLAKKAVADNWVYLPISMNQFQSSDPQGILLGISPQGYPGDQNVLDQEIKGLDEWSGKHTTLVSIYLNIEDKNPDYAIPDQLTNLRKNGYTGLINLMSERTMAEIANGSVDASLHAMAKAYAFSRTLDDSIKAFFAPFPEMNGDWYSYGEDPTNYKKALKRIQQIFSEEGIGRDDAWWVFAPNGYSKNTAFEEYYPGDSSIDVVAFSAYNYGYCPANHPYEDWKTPQEVFGSYLQRMTTLAPTKPIFITQTGTDDMVDYGKSDQNAKNQWLRDAYNYLAKNRAVKGVIYFNIAMECYWPIFVPGGTKYSGYVDGVANSAYRYTSPIDLIENGVTIR